MPDDRELTGTHASGPLLTDQVPGLAAVDELVVSRQSETLDSDDILAKKPLGLLFWFALGWVSLVVILAILANVLPLPNPNFQNYTALNAAPSIHHLLGTDDLGRDLLSRLIYGARVSLIVGFGSVAMGMLIGGTLGLVSGYKMCIRDRIDGFYPPTNHWDTNGFLYANAVFDPLMAVAANGTIQGYLASGMTSNSTFDTWTMTLRPGIKFNDGSALTSTVVKTNFEALAASALTGVALKQVASVTTPDPMTVVYTLTGPNPTFPAGLTTQVGYVVGQAMIDQATSNPNSCLLYTSRCV